MNHSISCMCGQCLYVNAQRQNIAQQNANALDSQNNINALVAQQRSIFSQLPIATGWHIVPRPMTASDLGIVDQNLDDKVGMEP